LAGKLNETLGPDAAGDLVTWLDEMRSEHREMMDAIRGDFAETRQEIHASESRLMEKLGGQMHALETVLRGEIHAVETRLGERLGDRIHGVETNLGERISGVEAKLGDRISGLETKLGDRIGDVSKEVDRSAATLIRWSFVFWVGAVAAIALLAGVLRT
jgi:hypothetical protein